jgi:integrase/recombinase XerD
VDKHLKEWNEKWFSPNSEAMKESRKKNEIPDFLNV